MYEEVHWITSTGKTVTAISEGRVVITCRPCCERFDDFFTGLRNKHWYQLEGQAGEPFRHGTWNSRIISQEWISDLTLWRLYHPLFASHHRCLFFCIETRVSAILGMVTATDTDMATLPRASTTKLLQWDSPKSKQQQHDTTPPYHPATRP